MNSEQMNILIFGASGVTGHQLVMQALERGHQVTAFIRQESKLGVVNKHLRIVRGDIDNFLQVAAALKGKGAVLSALGASSPFRYDQSVVDGLKIIVTAMKLCEVHRFVYMSFIGVKDSRRQGGMIIKYIAPVLLATEIRGHEARERIIAESNLGWTIVRPPTLTNGKQRRQYRSGENIESNKIAPTISRADVADFMLDQLTTDKFLFARPAVMY